MATAWLADRGVVDVVGAESRAFLDRLVTCDLDRVGFGRPRFGALLSPQGKILADFILVQVDADGAAFQLDCPLACIPDFVRRLTLYRLRAKVAISDSSAYRVLAGWDGAARPDDVPAFDDPRLAPLGWRAIVPAEAASRLAAATTPDDTAYVDHRIGLGVPESGRDFALADAFPHEALMDQLGGVDFDKGCYVGQEVVSRMQHRGTARTRIVSLEATGGGPTTGGLASGAEVQAGERVLGRVGSVSGARGLAMLRLDRAADALASGVPVTVGGAPVRFTKPDWARFPYPEDIAALAG